jgi:hypothetical protein
MKRAAVLALVLVSACSDDTDLTGIYMVTSDVTSSPCGMDMADPAASPFLKFSKGDFLGQSYFQYEGCTDETATSCSSTTLFDGLFEPIDNGWRGRGSSSSYSKSAMKCLLGYSEATAILNGNQLVIEDAHYSDEVSITEPECTPEEAEKRGAMMGCDDHTRIEATKR